MARENKKKRKKKKKWWSRSTRIVGMHPKTFDESWRITVSNLQIISIFILFGTALFMFNYLLFSYTPLGRILPESIKNRNKEKIQEAYLKVNQLEEKLALQSQYISNVQQVILGDIPIDSVYHIDSPLPSSDQFNMPMDTSSSKAEQELNQNLKTNIERLKQNQEQKINHLFLFDPVSGEISQKFHLPDHPGVDVVTPKDAQIKACLDGVVLLANYSNQDGYTVIISHKNNIISVYKHAKSISVKTGNTVKTGEAIGIVGNTGERSTGPHLHFELWNSAGPLNPLDYFSFSR